MTETFDEFLAARPQLQLDTCANPVPGWCRCPRYRIGDKPIFHRHAAGCDATGEATEAFTFVGADRVMQATTLEALAAWIPVPPAPPTQDPAATAVVITRMIELGFHLVALPAGTKKPRGRGLFLIASDLTAAACAAYIKLSGEAEAYRLGQLKGVGYAASKAAEATVTSRGVQSAMKGSSRGCGSVVALLCLATSGREATARATCRSSAP